MREAMRRVVLHFPVSKLAETIAEILKAHRTGAAAPVDTVVRTYARIRAHADPALFISLREEAAAVAEAKALMAAGAEGPPLYGIPVAIKDNIDVEGLPTTPPCPAFAYRPARDPTAVARLRRAGAIVVGKTNLDQFATGLVGVRSPYGIPRNALNPALIPGGASSGSAVAVAAGGPPPPRPAHTPRPPPPPAGAQHKLRLQAPPRGSSCPPAGSGRGRAALNNIVGLKPSLGLISTAGVVPACRSLDCVSIFGLTTDDCSTALAAIAGPDPADPYSRTRPLGAVGAVGEGLRLGVPVAGQRVFFGDPAAAN